MTTSAWGRQQVPATFATAVWARQRRRDDVRDRGVGTTAAWARRRRARRGLGATGRGC